MVDAGISFGGGNYRLKSEVDNYGSIGLSASDISYDGVFAEYFFDTKAKHEGRLFNVNCSTAVSRDPFTNEQDVWLSLGLASKYGRAGGPVAIRPPVNLVIVLDISGSMWSSFESGEGVEKLSKMEIAKSSLLSMLPHIRDDDRLGIVLFDDDTEILQKVVKWTEIDQPSLEASIKAIKTRGGTDIEKGYSCAADMLKVFAEQEKHLPRGLKKPVNRIMFLTDMNPTSGYYGDGNDICALAKLCAQLEIYSTFVGIGLDFNSETADKLTKRLRGGTCLTVNNKKEFHELLDDNFDYMMFPIVFDAEIRVISDTVSLDKVYGTHEADDATDKFAEIATIFPSDEKEDQTKGGVVLLKLKQTAECDDHHLTICLTYVNALTAEQEKLEYDVQINKQKGEVLEEYYQNDGVRKAVLLTRFVSFVKDTLNGKYAEQKLDDSGEGQTNLIEKFESFFKTEMSALKDETLARELKVLSKLSKFNEGQRRQKSQQLARSTSDSSANSGVHVDPMQAFRDMVVKSMYNYIIYFIVRKRSIELDKVSNSEDEDWDWDEFVDTLIESNEPRYGVVDFLYEDRDGNDKIKLLLIFWTPETARPGDKMLYASTLSTFKYKLVGIQKVINASDEEELDYDVVKKLVQL